MRGTFLFFGGGGLVSLPHPYYTGVLKGRQPNRSRDIRLWVVSCIIRLCMIPPRTRPHGNIEEGTAILVATSCLKTPLYQTNPSKRLRPPHSSKNHRLHTIILTISPPHYHDNPQAKPHHQQCIYPPRHSSPPSSPSPPQLPAPTWAKTTTARAKPLTDGQCIGWYVSPTERKLGGNSSDDDTNALGIIF
ncbi:hypothetical protein EJ03DRAFT_179862 [Teratosphaeria nubilosa]|uniref:Uncharacterized protein n=1 Tax=Teratosphaeria nubilosa TaxID=161662 RepID=A0A6G1L0I0_9PEZI|nr:hypothetical protein EJ03DRAFT_179862 [Teratosphaeria nubilosa]